MSYQEILTEENRGFRTDGEPIIVVENLYKSFGDNHVLRGFNLQLYEGENLVVVGRSGSGKSVLIKCMVGLLRPDSGKMEVLGKDIPSLRQDELDSVRTDVGFLFQGNALYDSMTVRENLEFPMRRHPEKIGDDYDRQQLIEEALDSVGLLHAIDLMPEELSGGMKKRVALARTLILRPKIILYDEPTSGLDPVTAKEINYLILEVQEKYNASALIITHDLDCAKICSNRMIILIEGQNYAEDVYANLAKSEDPKVKAFFT